MRVADQDYVLALHNGARVVNYATFTLANGTIKKLSPADFRVSGNTYTDKTTDGNSFSVGSFIGKTANISIDNSTGKFDGYDFYMSKFVLQEAIRVDEEHNTVKKVTIGRFTVVTDYTPGSVINFSAVDDSYKFDKKHNLTGVKTLKSIVSLACAQCLGSSTFDGTGNFDLHNTQVNTSKLDKNLSWRQIIGYIAIMTGNNAYIDATGILKFKWYDDSVFDEDGLDGGTFDTNTTPYSDGDTADGGDFTFSESTNYDGGTFTDVQNYHIIQSYKNFQIGTYDISITGVRVINGDTVVESLSSHQYNYSYIIEVKDNPLCEGIESTIASHLAGKLNDFTFRIFNCDVPCDPLIEAGDMALVLDRKGIAHRTLINDVSFQTGGYTRVACKAETIIRQQASYTSEAAKAVVEANRHTDDTLSSYDESVQRMNDLAQNSSGMYTARVRQQDGSYIYYSSDHVITYNTDGSAKFTVGSFVAKDAGAGYFYSTSAGLTDEATAWTGGIDRNGNAVLNTLALYKLTADWIIAGILQDALGINKWNLDNGDLQMTGGAKLKLENTDYSGAYVPTMGNAPAYNWNTSTANNSSIGKTFKDTSINGKIYIYRKASISYPETAHPYTHSDDKKYLIRTGLTAPVKIKFNANCETETNFDYLDVFYISNGTWYKKRFEGAFGGQEVVIPSNYVYLVWHTDSSVNKWGFAIDSITETDESPSTFTEEQIPSGTTTTIDAYVWEEVTIDNFTKLTSQREITENMTQEEIFNALTGGGAVQGIYIYNGKVYLNASFMNIGEIDANLIKVGALNADIIRDGTLIMGGTNDFNGKILVLGTNVSLNSSSGVTSAIQYLGYSQTGALGRFAITANLTGLHDDVTLVYEVYRTVDGTNFTKVDSGEITPGASSFIYTYPPIFTIDSTSGNRYYYMSIYDKDLTNTFNVAFSYAPITSILDENGVDTTKLIASGDCKFGNLEIGKKIIKPYGSDLEVSYVYAYGYKELFWNQWVSLSKTFNKKIYFSPYYDGWTSDCDVNISFYCDDTGSHDNTQVCRVDLYKWNGSSWDSQGYRRFNPSGEELNEKDSYFGTFLAGDQSLYRISVKITRYTWASDYEIDIYSDRQHTIEIDPYETIGSFRGNFAGAAEFYALSVGDTTFNPDGSIVNSDDDTTAEYRIKYEGFSSRISSSQYTNLLCDSQVVVEARKSSSEYIRINTSNPGISVYDSSSEYIDITTSRIRLQQDSSNYFYMSRTSISALWDGTSYYVDWIQGSDERIKEEIEPLNAELSKNLIDATEPKKFRYKSGRGKHYGMIAQQARKILDDLGETDSVLEYGPNVENEDIPNYRAIHYEEYIPHLINYVKMLNEKVEAQEARINQLEEKIKILKGDK